MSLLKIHPLHGVQQKPLDFYQPLPRYVNHLLPSHASITPHLSIHVSAFICYNEAASNAVDLVSPSPLVPKEKNHRTLS